MRFDDRLATALGQQAETAAARQAVWRQLVDLLSQSHHDDRTIRTEALDRLRNWRDEVPPSSRQSAAIMLARHDVPIDLVELFAEDLTAVAAPLLAVVQLTADDWVQVIPRLSPIARALLRHRRDLPSAALRMLEAYGPTDLVIPAPAPSEALLEDQPGGGQDIQALRARVDALREQRRDAPAPPVDATSFDYETGSDGIVQWCDLPHRGAIIGLSIADQAAPGRSGVDGQAAGAFRHRGEFRNSRLWLEGGVAGGAWSLSGRPKFDPASGRFLGYLGSARRPRAGERVDQPGLMGLSLTGDSARQFAHEMRTPLNAISGFAEMIQRQLLGPASSIYRHQAAEIMAEAARIGGVLDDLEEAARIEASGAAKPEAVDCALLIAQIASALAPAATEKGVLIALTIAPQCPSAIVDRTVAERLTTRLLSACVGIAKSGEQLKVEVAPGSGLRAETAVAVSRPRCVQELAEAALFDACDLDGAEEEPPLGLGFTLRFVRTTAEACGGRFHVDNGAFKLLFAAAPGSHGTRDQGEASTDWAEWLRRQTGPACHVESASAIATGPAGPVAQR